MLSRSSLASYILGLDSDSGKNKKDVEDMFSPVFSALLDAFLLRAQVFLIYLPCSILGFLMFNYMLRSSFLVYPTLFYFRCEVILFGF